MEFNFFPMELFGCYKEPFAKLVSYPGGWWKAESANEVFWVWRSDSVSMVLVI